MKKLFISGLTEFVYTLAAQHLALLADVLTYMIVLGLLDNSYIETSCRVLIQFTTIAVFSYIHYKYEGEKRAATDDYNIYSAVLPIVIGNVIYILLCIVVDYNIPSDTLGTLLAFLLLGLNGITGSFDLTDFRTVYEPLFIFCICIYTFINIPFALLGLGSGKKIRIKSRHELTANNRDAERELN